MRNTPEPIVWDGMGVTIPAEEYGEYLDAMAEVAAEQGYERWLEDAGSRWDPEGYEHERQMEVIEAMNRGEF